MNETSHQSSQPLPELTPLRRALLAVQQLQAKVAGLEQARSEPIAIVGIGCRYPGGVADAASFWRLLRDGVDAVTEVPPERWDVDAYFDPDPNAAGKMVTRSGGFVPGVDRFDAGFFGISPREALSMDPQQRFLLEVSWEALEHAGIVPGRLRGTKTGVFVGISTSDYAQLQLLGADAGIDVHSGTGSASSVAAGRISYVFGFEGPSIALDTACSSSLVALHLACASLRAEESDVALAGGVNLMLSPLPTVAMSKLGALSPDGRCRTLDAAANGYVRAEGCGMLVLKRLSQALAAGDRVLAVIRGSAVNQDGRSSGLTVPNGRAQQAVVREAHQRGKCDPAETAYVEAHGTGTLLGDPIEIDALGAVLGEGRRGDAPFFVGSVKTNFGHAESAAGVAGVIKTVLSLVHREIPPHLHFRELNPHIEKTLPLRVATTRTPWPVLAPRLQAGVSSFGFSGTNAHVVLEEAPASAVSPAVAGRADAVHMLPISAKDEQCLRALAASYDELLAGGDADLRDIVASAGMRRTHHAHRVAIVGATASELRAGLAAFAAGEPSPGVRAGMVSARAAKKVFVFSGQGSQWAAMGQQLLATEPVFLEEVTRCDRFIRGHGGVSPIALLATEIDEGSLKRVEVVQPLLFTMQAGLAALLRSWGVEPDAVVGHSMGEVAAAYVAGALGLEDAARVITLRSKIVSRVSGLGAMAVAEVGMARALSLLDGLSDRVAVAASNAADSVILSGEPAALGTIVERLQREAVFCRFVDVDYASHSPQMSPLLPELSTALGEISARAPSVPMISTVTAKPIELGELTAAYWARNLRSPVLFHEALLRLFRERHDVFLEVSPHAVLTHVVERSLRQADHPGEAIASMRRDQDPAYALKLALAALHVRGAPLDWRTVAPAGGFAELPRSPFRSERFWFESSPARAPSRGSAGHPLLGDAWTSSQGDGARFFQAELDLSALGYLADHVVQGAVVLPAAAYFEMALAAGERALGVPVRLESAELRAILELPREGTKTVQLALTQDGRTASFSVASLEATGEWITHASGTVAADDRTPPAAISLEECRARCTEALAPDQLYEQLSAAGLTYGPRLRSVQQLLRRDSEVLAEVRAADSVIPQLAAYRVHPALLDAAFHALAAAASSRGATFLPVGAGSVRVLAPVEPHVWCRATLAPASPDADVLSGDVSLVLEDGTVAVEVRDLRVQRVGRAKHAFLDWLYGVDWIPAPRAPVAAGTGSARTWLVTGEPEIVEAVQRLFRLHGDRSIHVTGPEELQRALGSPGALHGVLLLDALASCPPLEANALPRASRVLLETAQAVVRAGFRDPPRVFVATRATQCPAASEPGGSAQSEPANDDDCGGLLVSGAPLWGFVRSLAHEHPELRPTCVDLDAELNAGALAALVDEVRGDSEENQIAFRGSERYVARLVRRNDGTASSVGPSVAAEGRSFGLEIDTPGTFDRLTLRERPRKPPRAGEVEIEVHATGLNFLDVLMALGMLPNDAALDSRLGGECAGKIVALGAGVQDLAVGDEVMGVGPSCFASHVTLNSRLVVRKPAQLSMERAATVPITFLTAHLGLLQIGRLVKGERVLIHAAAGGVGLAAVQIAQQVGAEIFATAGNEQKRALLRSMGVPHVMDSRSLDFADEVRAVTRGEGVDVVLNSLAGSFIPKSLELLREYGRFVEIGKRDYYENKKLGLRPFLNNLSFSLLNLRAMLDQRTEAVRATLLEITQALSRGSLSPLPVSVFPASQAADAFRYMAQAKHVGKVVVSMKDPSARILGSAAAAARADGSYLVTGGLGGLGLEVAKWLVDQGARHLVLVGRHAPSEPALAALRSLEASQVEVTVETADVAVAADVARVLARVDASGWPLRGVVHAAGVLDDGVILEQAPERFARVLAPKLQGAWNLHLHTRERALDFFVSFSSAASVFGSPGQATYAAGNAFLDALSHHRRRRGLTALSINWGPWGEVGLAAAKANRGARLAAQGMRSLAPTEGIAALEHLLRSGSAQAAVVPIQARQFAQSHRRSAESPFFANFRDSASSVEESALRKELFAAAPAERRALLEAALQREVAQVLRIALRRVDTTTPFGDLGFDSLLAIELRNRLESVLGTTLPTSLLWGHRTIQALAPQLAARLGLELADAPAPAFEVSPSSAVTTLDELSADELAEQLSRELGRAGNGGR